MKTMKTIKLSDWDRFEIITILNVIEKRHFDEKKLLPFKITYRLKRIKDKLKIDLKEYVGKPLSEVKPILKEIVETYEVPTFTEDDVSDLLIFSGEITILEQFIV